MSREKDTALAIQFRKEFIRKNISIDYCKECEMIFLENNSPYCGQSTPSPDNCNLLKVNKHN